MEGLPITQGLMLISQGFKLISPGPSLISQGLRLISQGLARINSKGLMLVIKRNLAFSQRLN